VKKPPGQILLLRLPSPLFFPSLDTSPALPLFLLLLFSLLAFVLVSVNSIDASSTLPREVAYSAGHNLGGSPTTATAQLLSASLQLGRTSAAVRTVGESTPTSLLSFVRHGESSANFNFILATPNAPNLSVL